MRSSLRLTSFMLLFMVLLSPALLATHLRSGRIIAKQVSLLSVEITIEVYTDTRSEVLLGEGLLDFGDGSTPFSPPIVPSNFQATLVNDEIILTQLDPPDLEKDVAIAKFTITHTYSSAGIYLIGYTEPNRNEGILNVNNSVNTTFYTESLITLDSQNPRYHSPITIVPPVFEFALSVNPLTVSLAAVDSNDYKLRYSLVTPKSDKDTETTGFDFGGVSINPLNGLFRWDIDPDLGRQGEYNFAVRIDQYREDAIIGFLVTDFQVILLDSDQEVIVDDDLNLDENNRIVLPSGDASNFDITVTKGDGQSATIEAISPLIETGNLTFEVTETTINLKGSVSLNSTDGIDRDNPYVITIRTIIVPEQGVQIVKDINYLLYTRDIEDEIPDPDPVVITSTLPEEAEQYIKYYPNPALSNLNITFGRQTSGTIRLMDLNGRIVFSEGFNDKFKTTMNLEDLSEGIYNIEIRTRDDIKSFRFVKY